MDMIDACRGQKIEEDLVREGFAATDGSGFVKGAKQLLGLDQSEANVKQGTGQILTFQSLGFTGKNKTHKPDGWYLPDDVSKVAMVLETKNSKEDLDNAKWEKEIFDNIDVLLQKYTKVIGILYNGHDVRIFKNHNEVDKSTISTLLENKSYYIKLWTEVSLDTKGIYDATKRINDNLHFGFGMNDLKDRMIFTACALVAQRFNPVNGLQTQKGQDYDIVHGWISNKLAIEINKDNANQNLNPNRKLNILLEEYNSIQLSDRSNQSAIDKFIDDVCDIAELVNSDNWNGEDVMGIFFNEFSRYKGATEMGQVFTPDHITSFMYRLIGITMDDRVFDGTCGSGAFLAKSMCNMIREAGGVSSDKASEIKSEHLYGIELDRKIYALACANMLIHKDGKTNLLQARCETEESSDWIKSKNITKVLMNPPYERKNGCMKIVKNVLDSVPKGTLCAFILPDKKLEKDMFDKKKHTNKLLKDHRLTKIVKLPENLFDKGVITSIFVFIAGEPQKNNKIVGYYIEDDGLVRVKNQGRQDVKHAWKGTENVNGLEDYWISAICDDTSSYYGDTIYGTRQIIDPAEHLSYQMPKKPFEIYEEDFVKTMMDYEMFKRGIDVKEFGDKLLARTMYSSHVVESDDGNISVTLKGGASNED